MKAKTVPQVHAEAAQFLSELPAGALRSGSRLGRWDLLLEGVTVADGEAGRGVYFFFADDAVLSEHYSDRCGGGRRLVEVTLPHGGLLVDLTHPRIAARVVKLLTEYAGACGSSQKWTRKSFQRAFWGLMTLAGIMADRMPDVAGYVVPHVIPSCPDSKQVVVFRSEVLEPAHAA